MKKILVIVGTRPEAIKLIPLHQQLKGNKKWRSILVSTGQHKEMLKMIFDVFDVKPKIDLQLMTKNQSLDQLTSILITSCAALFRSEKPGLVVVQGDTTTSMSAALAAFYQGIEVLHVEAGLRSYDIHEPFPEEVNRRIISLISRYNFVPTNSAALALKQEKVQGRIFVVGNTVIDSLFYVKNKVVRQRKKYHLHYKQFLEGFKLMILITGHRRESFGGGFEQICRAIRELSTRYPFYCFIYPVHLNPRVREPVFKFLRGLPNVFLIEPIPYDHIVFLMMESHLILTDSGGIQEEAPSLGKPVVVMRNKTERSEGVKAGCSVLAGNSKQGIIKSTVKILENPRLYKKMSKVKNPYGQGNSARRIVEIMDKQIGE